MWVSLVLSADSLSPIGARTRPTSARSALASSRVPWTRPAKSPAQPDHLHHRAPAAPVLRALPGPDPVRPICVGSASPGRIGRYWPAAQTRDPAPCGVPVRVLPPGAVLTEDAGFRQAPYQRQDPLVPDALAHPPHQGGATGRARPGVRLENPLVIRGPRGELVHLGDRVLRPSSGPVRGRVEVGFEDRLQHQFQRRPDDPVRHGGDPQAADLAARLGDPPAAHPLGREPPGPHPSAQIGQDGERARRRHVAGDDPARLRRCARPCCCAHDPRATTRNAGPVHEVEQVIEAAAGLGRRPSVQLRPPLQVPGATPP